MKKTAMQEMIEQIDSIKEFDRKSTIFNLKEIAKNLLGKETQQIIDAHHAGQIEIILLSFSKKVIDGVREAIGNDKEDSEQYYNDTYGEGK